jgi:hypothetical protein
MLARQTTTDTAADIREMISRGYRPIECPSCTGQVGEDGRPVVVCVWLRPRKAGVRKMLSLSR